MRTKVTTVAEFVRRKVAPEHRAVVASLRAFMKRHAPEAREVLLQGVGKVSKHVKLKRAADINNAALRDYLKQALAFKNR